MNAMEVTAELIEKTVHQFYYDSSSQQQAHQWLTTAQISKEAWTFAWDLLCPSKATEVQFFGASTIYIKITRFWHELPPDHYEPLKQKLMELIVNYSAGPKLISSKLCISLASLIIRTIDSHWKNAINDITCLPENLLSTSLEVLRAVPEEFRTTVMASSQRGIVKNYINTSSKTVFALLEKYLQSIQACSPDITISCLKCLNSWVQFGADLCEIEAFLPVILKAVTIEDLSEISLETLANIVLHNSLSRFPSLVNKLLRCVVSFEPLLKKASSENNWSLSNLIYGVVANFCETHCRLLLDEFYKSTENQAVILQMINIMLQCSGTPGQYPVDETCSEFAFSFWYILQDDVMASEPKKTALFLQYIVPVYKSLVEVLLVKVCYPADEIYTSWNSDEKNQFRCYRQDIGDTLMYCYNVLRESMLNILLSHISVVLQTSKGTQWQELEACLFAFQSISETVGIEESTFLPSFFSCLLNIPMTNSKVAATALDSIGAYAEWIGLHPEVLGNVIPLLLLGLKYADVAPSATLALKELSRDCRLSMVPFVETILTASQAALQENIIKSNERIRLVATIGCVLSVIPVPAIMSYLSGIIVPWIQHLEAISLKESSVNNKPHLLLLLNMLSMLCSTLDTRLPNEDEESLQPAVSVNDNEQLPVFVILQQIMPLVEKIALQWSQDVEIIECVCLLLKRSCSTLLDELKPVLPATLQILLQMHQNFPNNHCIDLSKQLILLFGKHESENELIQSFLQQMVNFTVTTANRDFRNSTDLIETLLQMLAQILKKQFKTFTNSSVSASELFNFATSALGLPEAPTVKAASQFLSIFIHSSRENNAMLEVVNNNGEILLGYIFKIIGGEAPRCMVEYTTDMLLALNKKYFDNLCRWMNAFVSDGNLPSPAVTRQQREHYARLILRERTNRRKLQGILSEYTLLCRGLIGTEYAKQTSY